LSAAGDEGGRPAGLDAFQVKDDIGDFSRTETELRHGRVARQDTLGQGLFEHFDRVALFKVAQGRGGRQRTNVCGANSVAAGAVAFNQDPTALGSRLCVGSDGCKGQKRGEGGDGTRA
jgi:hypothetical protein